MTYTGNILINNRPFIQVVRNVMSSCSYQLNTTRISILIGICTRKSREKRMMNIDDLTREHTYKRRREDLHVPGKHNEICFSRLYQPYSFLLLCSLIVHWQVMEW